MYSLGKSYNTRLIEMSRCYDIREQLAEIGLSEEEIEGNYEYFKFYSLKIEGVDTRAANLLKKYVEQLGGVIAFSKEATEFTVRKTDVVITANKNVLSMLIIKLKNEPYDLDVISSEIKKCMESDNGIISWNDKVLDFNKKTYVMGILNTTPDSFFEESRAQSIRQAVEKADQMIKCGVDIIDIGGESSRPGAEPVDTDEEIRRVIPVVEAIRRRSNIIISVDTRKKEVAERALDAGADIINDITGLKHNLNLARLIARRKVPVILMHMRGNPKTMQKNPYYEDTVSEILQELRSSISFALGVGIPQDKIIIDPGIGFGKRVQDNIRIIRELKSFKSLNYPILVGLSRKSFIGEILGKPVEKRLIGTIVANTMAIINGANIVRVHDVGDTVEMIKVIDSIRGK